MAYEEIYYEDECFINITMVEVYKQYEKNGIGLELYKKFGEIYSERYNG